MPKSLSVHHPFRTSNLAPTRRTHEGGFNRIFGRNTRILVGLESSGHSPIADVVDSEGVRHSLRFQLLPHDSLLNKMIALSDFVLPRSDDSGDQLLSFWWTTLAWLRAQEDKHIDKERGSLLCYVPAVAQTLT